MNAISHLPSRFGRRRNFVLAMAWLGLAASAWGQTTLFINSATRSGSGTVADPYVYDTWKPLFGMPGGPYTSADGKLLDPVIDQQTGQSDSDFVSSAHAPGFFVQAGLINGEEYFAFRVMLNEYKISGNVPNVRIGFDGNNDGKVDLFFGPNLQTNPTQAPLVFQGADPTKANISPSTSGLTNNFGTVQSTAATFHYIELTQARIPQFYPGWVTQAESHNKTSPDGMLSFAVKVADINAALATVLGVNAYTIDANTLMRWVAFTATQSNSINQDVYGIGGSKAEWEQTWASFLPLMDAYGNPVPEPSTYGMMLLGLLGAGLGWRRWRRLRGVAAVKAT